MDIKSAFLASDLDKIIYMEQPEGFVIIIDGDEELVCRLLRSLYSLKQSPHMWNKKIHCFLIDNGFIQLNSDHCMYINKATGIVIAIWVNDIMIFAKNITAISDIKIKLNKEFKEMKKSSTAP